MNKADLDKTIAAWNRIGVLFGGRAARRSPDLDRLLLDTARLAPVNARLFYLSVSWLSQYGNFVARHRLKRLIEVELERDHQSALGALLALAVEHGASRELLIAADVCAKAAKPGPLFDVHRRSKALADVARWQACPQGLKWNVCLPDEPPKLDALRPAHWIIERNPTYLDRIVRKGDLRCSILLTLEHDVPNGVVESEVALAKLCSATRIAVRHALDDLEHEGYALRQQSDAKRNTRILYAKPPVRLAAG